MKKNIIALAVASAIAAPVAMADAPTIYGKLNVNINSKTDNGNGVNDTASRIGVKGSEDLGNGMKAVWKLEWDVDLEASGALSGRNQYLGLAGGFGTVLIGSHDSPLKMVQPTDLFNDGAADNSALKLGATGKTGEIRADRVLAYVSPTFSGVKLILAGTSNSPVTSSSSTAYTTTIDAGADATADADNTATTTASTTTTTSGDADDRALFGGTHFAVAYGSTKKGLFLSYGQDTFNKDQVAGLTADDSEDYTQNSFAAQYKTGGLTVNGMVRNFNNGDDTDKATIIGAAYKMGKITVKGKYMTADYGDSAKDDKGVQTAIGLGYALGKKTSAYVYTTNKNAGLNGAGDKTNQKSTTQSFVGLVHKF